MADQAGGAAGGVHDPLSAQDVRDLSREIAGLREDLQRAYLTKESALAQFVSREETRRRKVREWLAGLGVAAAVGIFLFVNHASINTNRAVIARLEAHDCHNHQVIQRILALTPEPFRQQALSQIGTAPPGCNISSTNTSRP